jgi:hypothetical protein
MVTVELPVFHPRPTTNNLVIVLDKKWNVRRDNKPAKAKECTMIRVTGRIGCIINLKLDWWVVIRRNNNLS